MSTNLTSTPISENQFNLKDSHQVDTSNAIETKPAKMDSATSDTQTNCNETDDIKSLDQTTNQKSDSDHENKPQVDIENIDHESSEQKNDSSTFSTAFTISFEDDSNKKLGIKDSIRKFAPPKPHTIEKQRQAKADQENSLMSIESAPGGFTKHSSPIFYSSRSSSRKSNSSSRHSNVSESAAFLIERMLNFKPTEREPSNQNRAGSIEKRIKSPLMQDRSKASQPKRTTAHSSDGILESAVENCEEKSDNGTYVVGADPETDAARKKIDELFGVVKAAEASVLAESASRNQRLLDTKVTSSSRQSRAADKNPLNRERQEHINRLARNSSRSSSSSRHEGSQVNPSGQQSKMSSHRSRNSSCDRSQKPNHKSKPRRAASQSSRQSSNKELSDCDTRSSRSSLHNEVMDEVHLEDNSPTNYPSMKFNRAFALRRARLGLGEPIRTPQNQIMSQDSDIVNKISSSQKRHQINTNTYRASQNQSSSSASFCRDDGGRFSLRMKQNNPLSSRVNHNTSNNRTPLNNAALESYTSKIAESKICVSTSINGPSSESSQVRNLPQRHALALSAHATTGMAYQSGDELDATLSPNRYRYLQKTGRLNKAGGLVETDDDAEVYSNRFNYSTGADQDFMSYSMNESRASTSSGRRENTLQLGALDSLVISAISSLSLKIRQSVCEVLVEQAKKLPVENETRLIVEEIMPQLTATSSNSKSPTSVEEIDQSLYFDLAKTLKNLKKVEQMVEVIALISNQLPSSFPGSIALNSNSYKCNNKSDLN